MFWIHTAKLRVPGKKHDTWKKEKQSKKNDKMNRYCH